MMTNSRDGDFEKRTKQKSESQIKKLNGKPHQ
jgi:hypothetical protein